MATLLIIISIMLWLAAFAALFFRMVAAPAFSYLGLLMLSLAKDADEIPLIPINSTILIGWLAMTLIVIVATLMQPAPIQQQNRGVAYMLGGAIVGMTIGLLGVTFLSSVSMLYGVMVIATAAGTFFGYLLFTNTPAGRALSFGSGNFYTYLLAKGFPTAVAVMMAGVPLVILAFRA